MPRVGLYRLAVPVVAAVAALTVGLAIVEQTRFELIGWSSGFSTLVAVASIAVGTVLLAVVSWLSLEELRRERGVAEAVADELRKERKLVQLDRMRKDKERELAEEMIEEMEREREALQAALGALRHREQRQGTLAVFSEQLERLRQKVPTEVLEEDGDVTVFHPGATLDEPGIDVTPETFEEIASADPELPAAIESFNRLHEQYASARSALKADLARYFERSFLSQFDESDRAFLEYVLEFDGVDASPEGYVSANADSFAEDVLLDSEGSGLSAYVWSVAPVSPAELRAETFAEEFVELGHLFRNYREQCDQLDARLERVRDEWTPPEAPEGTSGTTVG